MQDQAVQWDMRSMTVHTSGFAQIFAVYILSVLFIGCWKIVRVWRILFKHLSGDQIGHILELEKVAFSIRKWTQFTFLIWGVCVSFLIAGACQAWSIMSSHYISVWPNVLHEIASFTAAMLFVVMLLHLGRWHVEKRASFLSGSFRR